MKKKNFENKDYFAFVPIQIPFIHWMILILKFFYFLYTKV